MFRSGDRTRTWPPMSTTATVPLPRPSSDPSCLRHHAPTPALVLSRPAPTRHEHRPFHAFGAVRRPIMGVSVRVDDSRETSREVPRAGVRIRNSRHRDFRVQQVGDAASGRSAFPVSADGDGSPGAERPPARPVESPGWFTRALFPRFAEVGHPADLAEFRDRRPGWSSRFSPPPAPLRLRPAPAPPRPRSPLAHTGRRSRRPRTPSRQAPRRCAGRAARAGAGRPARCG